MFYPKNVPNWERISRIVLGVAMIILAVFGAGSSLRVGLLLFSGAFVIITGFIGFCPMCALVGRKLKAKTKA